MTVHSPWLLVRGGAGELGGIFIGTWHCPSWRLSIIVISQVWYIAIIDNLSTLHLSCIDCPGISIPMTTLGHSIDFGRWSGRCTWHNFGHKPLWFVAENMSRCGDVPVDFALLCHNGPYLGDDMHMCALRRLHSMALKTQCHSTTSISYLGT